MKVLRQNRYHIKKTHPDYELLLDHMRDSKAVYNFANYLVRQRYFRRTGRNFNENFLDEFADEPVLQADIQTYLDGNKMLSSLLKNIVCAVARRFGCKIIAKVVQNVVDKLHEDWNSFFEVLKRKKNGDYDEKVRPPRYKKEAFNLVEDNPQVVSKAKLKDGFIGTAKMKMGVKLRRLLPNETVQSFRVYWENERVLLEVVFAREVVDMPKENECDGQKIASVDLGVDNLMTVAFNYERRPIVISGMEIKSLNRFFNKEKAKLQAKLPKGVHSSKKIRRLLARRHDEIRNLFGRIANRFVAFLLREGVTKLIVGEAKGWKDEVDIGHVNNQNFVHIPFGSLVKILRYKCDDVGILLVTQDESYTSKASFLDNDFVPTYRKHKDGEEKPSYAFSGSRVKRGLYRTKDRVFINADLNGALNIMRKSGDLPPEKTSSLAYLKRYKHLFPIPFECVA